MYLPRLLSDSDPVCEEVLSSSCTDLGCDSGYLVTRARLQAKQHMEHDGSDAH